MGHFDDGTPVMGLPGCVMYAGATIFDLILPRAVADVPVTRADLAAMGESGGLLEGTCVDLLENKVTLTVPFGNPKGIESFDRLAELLKAGDVILAMGNSDVPVGQYTRKIFSYYGLDEEALAAAGVLTYGSNVKEVTTHGVRSHCGLRHYLWH